MSSMSLSVSQMQELTKAVLKKSSIENLNFGSLQVKQIEGGFSNTDVFIASHFIAPIENGVPRLVIKAGQGISTIQKEIDNRNEYSEVNEITRDSLKNLKKFTLDGISKKVVINGKGWYAMAYNYIGPDTCTDFHRYWSFQKVFEDYCGGNTLVATGGLQIILNKLFKSMQTFTSLNNLSLNLTTFLPIIKWSEGIENVINTVAVMIDNLNHLENFRRWWKDSLRDLNQNHSWPGDGVTIHGDLRFENIILDKDKFDPKIIDFGSVKEGHIFADLVKLECDLLFRLNINEDDQTLRNETIRAAFCSPFIISQRYITHNKQLDALRILRKKYYNICGFNQEYDIKYQLYKVFLAAEVMKRLLYHEEVFTSSCGRYALFNALTCIQNCLFGCNQPNNIIINNTNENQREEALIFTGRHLKNLSDINLDVYNYDQIKYLNLENNQLNEFPKEILKFKNLEILNLSNNNIAEIKKEDIIKLPNLTELKLAYNNFQKFPECLVELHHLKKLDLSFNQIFSIPKDIERMSDLELLWLMSNRLENIPNNICKLHRLEELDISINQITHLPNFWGSNRKLKKFYAYSNKITKIPNSLVNIKTLQFLGFHNNKIDKIPTDILQSLLSLCNRNLKKLYLTTNPFILKLKIKKSMSLKEQFFVSNYENPKNIIKTLLDKETVEK